MSIAPEFTASNSSSSPPSACPLCGARQPSRSRLATGRFPLLDCAACGAAFLFPQPRESELAAFYDETYYGKGRKKFLSGIEIGIAVLTWLKWRRMRALLQPGERLLDIGCGRGTLIGMARASGYEAYGIERPSPLSHSLPHIYYQDLPECHFPDQHFQLVILLHVLEHLPDPQATLAEIYRIVKPGGWVSLAVPNYGGAQAQASGRHWFHLDLPRHLWHFRRSGLETMLEKTGFRATHCSTLSFEYDWFGTIQSWMNRAFDDNNRLYSALKGDPSLPVVDKMRRLVTAAVLALPALGSVFWDAASGQGGTLTVTAQKTLREPGKR